MIKKTSNTKTTSKKNGKKATSTTSSAKDGKKATSTTSSSKDGKKAGSTTSKKNGKKSNEKSKNDTLKSSQLMELFEDGLKDIYWAEKALTKALPKMIKKATSKKLVKAIKSHLAETEEQVTRVEQVFKTIDKKAVAKKCEAMEGLIKEAEEIMKSSGKGPMCDAGIISASQKVEHYEIATYGTLRQFAKTLDLKDARSLLNTTLKEEKAADKKLTKVAKNAINVEATQVEA